MALLQFNNIGISGISVSVPKNTIKNREYTKYFSNEEVNQIVDKIGIEERRFVEDGVCSSDLCYHAAEALLKDLKIDKSEIDLLIFVSQTPDYRMPATSIILQNKLGLSKNVMSFDINLGCSGYVYALAITFSLLQNQNLRKALLLVGETRSKAYYPKDRRVAFLFGDAGSATLIESMNVGHSFFSMNSDGSRSDLIMIKGGGYRYPSSVETLKERIVDQYGNISTDEHGSMNGSEVFNFVIQEIPKDLNEILKFSNTKIDDIDFFLFHQANAFMNDYLIKKLSLDREKVPSSLKYFGNTSSVSIPLTIVSQLKNKLNGKKKILLSGFGVGMSWASSILNTNDLHLSDLIEI